MFEPKTPPEALLADAPVKVGGFIWRMEVVHGRAVIHLFSEHNRTPVADLDVVAGQTLYGCLREEELTRRVAEEAEREPEKARDDDEVQDDEEEIICAVVTKAPEDISIFTQDELAKSLASVKHQEPERVQRVRSVLKSAGDNGGCRGRPVEDIATVVRIIAELNERFPNFSAAIEFLEASLALSLDDPEYVIPPLLVHGEPGIGKTTFAMAVAESLGVPFDLVSAGSLQGGFDLCGTSQHWSNAHAGRVVRLLAEGDSASPVFLIDEVDKIGGDDRYSAVNALLDLLEPRTARRYRDEALQLQFDASRLITIMTANELRSVPLPLQSRAQVVEIRPPNAGQRLEIVRALVDRYAGEQELDETVVRRIATSGDLRKVQQLVRKAAGLCRARGDQTVFLTVLEGSDKTERKGRVGFI